MNIVRCENRVVKFVDKNLIKVGERIKCMGMVVVVLEVSEYYILVFSEQNSAYITYTIEELWDMNIEKVESNASKFATGQLYRVEDTYSCDKFDVLIMTVSDSEITAMKLKSASAMSIKESEIDARYKFTKIKTVEENQNVLSDKDKSEIHETLWQEFWNTNKKIKPVFLNQLYKNNSV